MELTLHGCLEELRQGEEIAARDLRAACASCSPRLARKYLAACMAW
jgi:hypothetical protein